ncbi:AI-2E family transporter [Yaniella flava]|uniref:AI-2E family transporter n=1 Tax=Yaniella flava TaxID=287930 RepID=A0ABP5FR48_9MICC
MTAAPLPDGATPLLLRPDDRSEHNRTAAIPQGVMTAAGWSWRLLIIIGCAAVLVWLLSYIWILVVPLFIAAMMSTLLSPGHQFLHSKFRIPSILSALLVTVTLVAGVIGLAVLTGQQLASGFSSMRSSIEAGVDRLLGLLVEWGMPAGAATHEELMQSLGAAMQTHSGTIVTGAIGFGSGAANIIAGVATTLFATIFFLKDGPKIWQFLLRFVPSGYRRPVYGAGHAGWRSLGAYTRVQILVAFIDAVGIGLGAWLLDVPLALPLGVLVFLGSFIPIVGAVLTGAIAVLLALVANGWGIALAMLAVVLVVQQVESNVMQPLVMGRAVNLHPLAVFLAVAAGVAVGGFVGAIFAVPLMAFANEFVRHLTAKVAPGTADTWPIQTKPQYPSA